MKKLQLIFLFLPVISFGQIKKLTIEKNQTETIDLELKYDSTTNYFSKYGNNPTIYNIIGQELYLNDKYASYWDDYEGFYKNYKKSKTRKSNVYHAVKSKSGRIYSQADLMIGKSFVVKEVHKVKEDTEDEFYLELEETQTNEIVFFQVGALNWHFIVRGYFEKLKETLIDTRFLGVYDDKYDKIKELRSKAKLSGHDFHREKWMCRDIFIDDFYHNFTLLLNNERNDTIFLSLKDIPTKESYHFYDVYSSYHKDILISKSDASFEPLNYNINKVFSIADSLVSVWMDFYIQKIIDLSETDTFMESYLKQKDFNFNNFKISNIVDSKVVLEDDSNGTILLTSSDLNKFLGYDYFKNKTPKINFSDLQDKLRYKSFEDAKKEELVMNIIETDAHSPNSAGGVDFSIDWYYYNTRKDVKYIDFTVIPYNMVGDLQTCDIRGHSRFIGQVTGPIVASSAIKSSVWETAWYNSTIKYLKIIKIEIEYIDGTRYTYVKDLKNILSPYILNH